MALGGDLYLDLSYDVEAEDFGVKVGELANKITRIVAN